MASGALVLRAEGTARSTAKSCNTREGKGKASGRHNELKEECGVPMLSLVSPVFRLFPPEFKQPRCTMLRTHAIETLK